jgi:hypothetical protein
MAWERTLQRPRKSARLVAFIILEQNKALEAASYHGHPLKRPALEKLVNNRSRWLRLPLF